MSGICNFLFLIIMLNTWNVFHGCRMPPGPIFTALSFWEALSAGCINVVELFLLADHVNGTVVDPYINDINSQHPFSGRKTNGNLTRRFTEVFEFSKLNKYLKMKTSPVMNYRITSCLGLRDVNAIHVNYSESFDEYAVITGEACMDIIGVNNILKMEKMILDAASNYYCISHKRPALPAAVLQSYSINVIINWQGLRANQPNRIQWYSKYIDKSPPVSEIFSTIKPDILQASHDLLKRIKKPYLTLHLRVGRMLSLYHEEAIKIPHIYMQIGDLVTECIVYHVDKMIAEKNIKSILVLDDFDLMSYHPEMMFTKRKMQANLKHAYELFKSKTDTDIQLSLDILAEKAGCTPVYNSTYEKRWSDLVKRVGTCSKADKNISENYVLLDINLAANADYVMRVGRSLFGETMCEYGHKKKGEACLQFLKSGSGFRHSSFQQAMVNDCPLQYDAYAKLLDEAAELDPVNPNTGNTHGARHDDDFLFN